MPEKTFKDFLSYFQTTLFPSIVEAIVAAVEASIPMVYGASRRSHLDY